MIDALSFIYEMNLSRNNNNNGGLTISANILALAIFPVPHTNNYQQC